MMVNTISTYSVVFGKRMCNNYHFISMNGLRITNDDNIAITVKMMYHKILVRKLDTFHVHCKMVQLLMKKQNVIHKYANSCHRNNITIQ